jgi:hypothetical protein
MKHWLVYTIVSLLLFSCGKKQNDGAVSMSIEKRDSLLLDHILKEFDYDFDYQLYNRYRRDYQKQLSELRNDTSDHYTHQANFKNYNFRSFLFDSQRKPPFVVEITNENGEFISFFSFTDEAYYSANNVTFRKNHVTSERSDSILQNKINLESNLNELAKRLNIDKNKGEMLTMVNILCTLLEMNKTTEDSIRDEVETIHSNSWINDSTYNVVKKERSIFFNKGSGDVLTVKTQYGAGYWRFWIEKNKENFTVRAAFFSDILYVPTYM